MRNIKYIFVILLVLLIPSYVYAGEYTGDIKQDTDKAKEEIKEAGSSEKIILDDQANLLTDDQELLLRSDMAPLTEFGNVVFVSISSNQYGNSETFAREYYRSKFQSADGVLFVIDMQTRQLTLMSRGTLERTLTPSKNTSIVDNVFRLASAGNYYECAKRVFEQAYRLLTGGKIAEPMRYISAAIIALCSSSFIGFMIAYAGFRLKKQNIKETMASNKYHVDILDFDAQKTGQHSVYNPPSSSSSGGGGGFSGGGGGGSCGSHGF